MDFASCSSPHLQVRLKHETNPMNTSIAKIARMLFRDLGIMTIMKLRREEILRILSSVKPQLQKAGVVEIGLFGSYAKGRESVYSDVDIAIRKEKDIYYQIGAYGYFEMLEEIRDVLRKKLHRKIDLFDLDSNSPFKKEIEKEVIYV